MNQCQFTLHSAWARGVFFSLTGLWRFKWAGPSPRSPSSRKGRLCPRPRQFGKPRGIFLVTCRPPPSPDSDTQLNLGIGRALTHGNSMALPNVGVILAVALACLKRR